MPNYVYEHVEVEKGCDACTAGIEVFHGLSEAGPEKCPHCGAKLRRRLTAPNIGGRWTSKTTLSDANLKRHGFKKLHNEGGGKFRVT